MIRPLLLLLLMTCAPGCLTVEAIFLGKDAFEKRIPYEAFVLDGIAVSAASAAVGYNLHGIDPEKRGGYAVWGAIEGLGLFAPFAIIDALLAKLIVGEEDSAPPPRSEKYEYEPGKHRPGDYKGGG
jgi:hypothetical protein